MVLKILYMLPVGPEKFSAYDFLHRVLGWVVFLRAAAQVVCAVRMLPCSWWWAYVPEICRAKNTSIKLPCCTKLAFQIISRGICTVKQLSSFNYTTWLFSGRDLPPFAAVLITALRCSFVPSLKNWLHIHTLNLILSLSPSCHFPVYFHLLLYQSLSCMKHNKLYV